MIYTKLPKAPVVVNQDLWLRLRQLPCRLSLILFRAMNAEFGPKINLLTSLIILTPKKTKGCLFGKTALVPISGTCVVLQAMILACNMKVN